MLMCIEEDELKDSFKNVFLIVLTSYRFSTVTSDFKNQLTYLVLLLSLLRHIETRHLVLESVLFDIIQFPAFMHIKPPDDCVLEELIPDVWWDKLMSRNDKGNSQKTIDEIDELEKQRYYRHCGSLKMKITELEEIQVEILKLLLDNSDASDFSNNKSSRALFIVKFRDYLVTCIKGPKYTASPCPLPVSLCFMHRLVKALRYFWDMNAHENSVATFSYDAFVPIWVFTTDKRPRAQMQCDRLGGVLAHLKKNVTVPENLKERDISPSTDELVEILDGVILLYEIAAHKQLVKMSELRDNFREMVCALNETNSKLSICAASDVEVRKELMNSKSVLESKVIDNSRHLAWLIAVLFSKEKQEDVHWILKCSLRTTEKAIAYENLYSYVPEYYVEVILNCYKALTKYFSFVTAFEGAQGYISTLNQMAFFLSHNFSDTIIVNTDVRDSIIQSLACFVCYPESLKSLEQMPLNMRKSMIKTLLSPYESRSWPQINWILVRLWKGCGFGYRYDLPPHMSPTRLKHYTQDFDSASFQKPCPSLVFQQHVAEALTQDEDFMLAFVNSVLNQLNWAFSEFLTQLSEIQTSSALFDKRKYKLVATCFDLSVGLLRVIELIVAVSPHLFTDASRANSEILLNRLMQLISQVLCRVTSQNGAFQQVIRKKGLSLDSVDNYPILTAVAGILVRLAFQSTVKGRDVAIMTLLGEATFSVDSLDFMIPSASDDEVGASAPACLRRFSFNNYCEVSAEEIDQVKKLVHILRTEKRPQSALVNEDDLCTICYAEEISVRFQPCGHTSCRSCIQHQLMNKNECFYCKGAVDKFVKINSK
jgi:Kip1 ubiquitination-promoting complex protein 1